MNVKRKRRQIVVVVSLDIDERVPEDEVAQHFIVLVAKHDSERAPTRIAQTEVLELQDENGEQISSAA